MERSKKMFQYNVYVREVHYGREAGQVKHHLHRLHRHGSLLNHPHPIPTMTPTPVQAKHERSAGADSYTVGQLAAGTQHQVVTMVMVVVVMVVMVVFQSLEYQMWLGLF